MHTETRTTDAQGRLVLPKTFANATVIVEHISESEVRIRRAEGVDTNEFPFVEETVSPLTDRDRDHFLELLAAPPTPAPALQKAAKRTGLAPATE